ncbi:MAG: hypothetical protein ACYDC5_13680 [Candidatus Dormibacteria bacterium]
MPPVKKLSSYVLFAAAGLAPMNFHHLVHAFPVPVLPSGVDLGTVSDLLDHSNVSLTPSTYAGAAHGPKLPGD